MSLRKKKPTGVAAKKTLSDSIAELLLPQPLLDPEIDGDDETRAQTHAYDEHDADEQLDEIDLRLSDIRKKNVKLLQDVDSKYSGQISSRRDFEDVDDEESEEDDDESDAEQSDDVEADDAQIAAEEDEYDVGEEQEDDEDNVDDEQDDDDDSDADDDVADDAADSDSDFEDDDDGIDLAPKSLKSNKRASSTSPTPLVDSTVHVKPANVIGDMRKGHSVQNQLHIWEKLLEMRIHSQKILIHANTLPAHDQMGVLRAHSAQLATTAAKTSASVSTMLDRLTELQSLLVAKFPESKDLNPRKRKHEACADDDDNVGRHGAQLADGHSAYAGYRDAVLLKWYDRTKVLTPGTKEGRHAAQHNILQNIAGTLANRSELVRKTQLHKGGYNIIGMAKRARIEAAIDAPMSAEAQREKKAEDELHSAEIYDDSDFYHTQLRELIEFKANAASSPDEMNRQFAELQKLRKKMKKVVDTRASKGRKIRYVVHNKMVNFMARNDASEWTDEGKTELYSSLFGARMGGGGEDDS